MKENTFDIPSVKFCIGYRTIPYGKRICEINETFILVPFEDIDGLTIDDVLKTINNKEFVFAAISLTKSITSDVYNIGYLVREKFDSDSLQSQMLDCIDKVVEKRLEEKYSQANEKEKRIYQSFFEKYQDGSYLKTKERIKRLEMRKHNKR